MERIPGDKFKIYLEEEFRIVPGIVRGKSGVKFEHSVNLELITPKIKLNIPRNLFIYLTSNFYKDFGNVSLYEQAIIDKQNALRDKRGLKNMALE